MNFNTKLLHGKAVEQYPYGSTLPPVVQSNAYRYDSFETLERVFSHKAAGYAYSRIGNPTVAAFERRINELEGGAGAVATASGMAAISQTLLTFLSPGDEVIAANSLYGGTLELFEDLEKLGIRTRFVSRLDTEETGRAFTDRTRCIFGELISNPALQVLDVPAVSEFAHAHSVPLLVDSTTATPYIASPIALGADIVLHSSSKYISGSGNAISGVIIDSGRFAWSSDRFPALQGVEKWGKLAFLTRLRTDVFENFGGCLAPQNAFLNVLGLETLGLRMERICRNAAALAAALEAEGLNVSHLSLTGHPDHELCVRELGGLGGGILTFRAGSREKAVRILNSLRYASIASNIGDVRTLVIYPFSTIFLKNTKEQCEKAGVYEDTLRVSVGIEDAADLIDDFLTAIRSA